MASHQRKEEEEDEEEIGPRNIVFFDVETTVPSRIGQGYELLEFGAVVLDGRGLAELHSFHTLVRPKDLASVTRRTTDCNGIIQDMVASAPTFAEVSNHIFNLLHGQIWAGHNIMNFDNLRVSEAFSEINQPAPKPFGVIDTYPLLKKTFGKRAGNYKLQSLANYCGYGKQEHRSLADVRMNVDVLRSCATMLFLESNYPEIFPGQQDALACASATKQSPNFSRFAMKGNAKVSEVSQLSTRSTLTLQSERPNMDAFSETNNVCSSTMKVHNQYDDETHLSSESVSFFKNNHFEDAVTHCQPINDKLGVANVMIAESREYTCPSTRPEMIINEKEFSVGAIPDDILLSTLEEMEKRGDDHACNLSESLISMSLRDATSDGITTKLDEFSSLTCRDEPDLRTQDAPFLAASHVLLESIEVREEPSYVGLSKVIYCQGFPLKLLEYKIKVRFTVNMSYAFDEKGKPRFSVLVEPSEAACEVIQKCEELVKSKFFMCTNGSEIEWLPALRNETGVWATRMSIGTKGIGSSARYTTSFYRPTPSGLKNIVLDPVDVSTFRNVVLHGSVIDVGFGFYVFNYSNRAGVRLVARHITIH